MKKIVIPFLFSSVYCWNVLEQKWRTRIELSWTWENGLKMLNILRERSTENFISKTKQQQSSAHSYILHLFSVFLYKHLCSREKIYSHFCKCSHFTWQHIILSFHYEILMDIFLTLLTLRYRWCFNSIVARTHNGEMLFYFHWTHSRSTAQVSEWANAPRRGVE